MIFTAETAGLVSHNRPTKELNFDRSVHSNEEEHLKTNYAVVDDYDSPVEKSPHKRGRISARYNYNWGFDESEPSNK